MRIEQLITFFIEAQFFFLNKNLFYHAWAFTKFIYNIKNAMTIT